MKIYDKLITQDETSTSQNRLLYTTSKIVGDLSSSTICRRHVVIGWLKLFLDVKCLELGSFFRGEPCEGQGFAVGRRQVVLAERSPTIVKVSIPVLCYLLFYSPSYEHFPVFLRETVCHSSSVSSRLSFLRLISFL